MRRHTVDPSVWAASTMLYFAAAASYERLQTAGGDAVSDRLFLLADEPCLLEAVAEASRYLDRCSDIYADGYEHLVQEAIRPYNQVGLFRPEVPNMYAPTAAQKEAVIR